MDKLRAEIESSMCALLRGEEFALQHFSRPEIADCFRELVAHHGLAPLLAARLKETLSYDVISTILFPPRRLLDAAAIELIRSRELGRVLRGLGDSGVQSLVLKGAALAHSVYPSPVMRPRADADLLIPENRRHSTHRALAELGYEAQSAVTGKLVTYQRSYGCRDRFGIVHVLDIHWRVSNTQAFSRVLDYETLQARSAPVPALCEHARTLDPADALLLACMHRVHHLNRPYRSGRLSVHGGDRLIWIYDIHLLLEAMTREELTAFAELAGRSGMRAVCRDGVTRAMRCFGTGVPADVLGALQPPAGGDRSERHLRLGRLHHLVNELRTLARWRDRLTLVSEHLFPSKDYMLGKYSVRNRAWLPLLYVHRGIHGACKRILDW